MIQRIMSLLPIYLFALSLSSVARAANPVVGNPSLGFFKQVSLAYACGLVDALGSVGPLAQATARPESLDSSAEESIEEATLLEFVEKHQEPLLKLLRFMKKKQPQQYQQALKELARVKHRLSTLEKRDSESHAIELELWQVRSNLRMLVAEILVSEKEAQDKLKAKLHELVEKEIDLDTARLKLEQKRIEQRLSSVQSQLNERTESRDAALSKAIKTWENRAFKSANRSKPIK